MEGQGMISLQQVQKKSLVRIVDDEADFVDAINTFLTYRGWTTATYDSADAFLRADTYSKPGCVLLDIRMPGMSGLQLQEKLKQIGVRVPIIFLSAHGDIDTAVMTIQEGAVNFLQKSCDSARIVSSVEKACRLSLQQSDPLGFMTPQQALDRAAKLSRRELDILALVKLGLSSTLIGERLGISARTADAHRASAAKKLGVHSTEEMLAILELAKEG